MMKQRRSLFVVLIICLMLVSACGGASTGEAPAASDGESSAAPVSGQGETRVKQNAAVGPAPVLLTEGSSEGPAARGATGPTSDVAGVCLSADEGELARLVNEYRASLGLPALQISKSLSLVAQQHAWDSVNNRNSWPTDPNGRECNLHSWTSVVNPALQQGTWTANCYTSDHANAEGMWNKPAQIAGFPGEGVENSFWSSGTATPSGALTGWKNSPGHNNVMTQQGGWGPMAAMGVGMLNGIAHLWLSSTADPAGDALLCSGGNPMTAPPTAVPPTAVPPTAVPPTDVPPTAESTTAAEATTIAPTDVPPTAVPPTVAPTSAPTGEVLNQTGEISAGGSSQHTFNTGQGRTYTVVISPSAEFDVAPQYQCTTANGSASGDFDWNWEGEAETFTYTAPADGSCTVTIGGYQGSSGSYTIVATAR